VPVDDSIQVRCTRCKSKFRDKARRIRDGYSRQCPSCECMVFFIEGSPNKDVQAALREAERVRKLLRQEEFEKVMSRSAAAAEAADHDGEEGEAAPTVSRRVERRAPTAGRGTRSR
jgi:hypothetical protein